MHLLVVRVGKGEYQKKKKKKRQGMKIVRFSLIHITEKLELKKKARHENSKVVFNSYNGKT